MPQIKIASWNVNSINARIKNLLFWLSKIQPDIVLLQEIKCQEQDFPKTEISNLGYEIAIFGQKSYNGVAILSKYPLKNIKKNIDQDDEQARYIEAEICINNKKIKVASIYVPNGGDANIKQSVNESSKFAYKMQFFDKLYLYLKDLLKSDEISIFGGDFNVAIADIDVYNPQSLEGKICFHIDEKTKLRQIFNLGYLDSFRIFYPNVQSFTWWDYRGNSYNYGKGLRIDYIITSPKASDHLISAQIDEFMMQKEKPSDHCPVLSTFLI